MIDDATVAVGVPVYKRTEKLQNLLTSVESAPIDTVYVADNGHTEERVKIYEEDWTFDLEVLDLEYDSGLGNCRSSIVDALSEDYLIVVDSDHTIPTNVGLLVHQLEKKPEFGGICGLLFENGGLRGTCHDLYESNDVLIRDIREKNADIVAGAPFVEFEFLQNVAAFRRECVEEYSWDPNLKQGKPHLDFYVGHKHRTDWRFALCPSVQFPHFPGGSSDYQANRNKRERLASAREYFLNKWGYRQIIYGQVKWLQTEDHVPSKANAFVDLGKSLINGLPVNIQAKIMDTRLKIRELQNKPPL